MKPCSCHSHLHANAKVMRYDPTRTQTIRKAFIADFNRRFAKVVKAVRVSIVDNDALGLNPRLHTLGPLESKRFEFKTSAEKVDEFMGWFRSEVNREILEPVPGPAKTGTAKRRWPSFYIDSAYKQGIRRGWQEMEKQKIPHVKPSAGLVTPMGRGMLATGRSPVDYAFVSPIHSDRVALIYTRVYEELRGVTDAMAQQVSRVLAEGMAEGLGPEDMAKGLVDRMESIGITRARTIARTETIRAHHVANIMTYQEAGLEGVIVIAEWKAAPDDRVCPDCILLQGKMYTLEEILPMIPLHPNCRCVAVPIPVESNAEAMAIAEAGME